jgi:cytochrome c-type biogenesis protein CcmH
MIEKDLGNDEIIQFLVDRYGDFVLYRPPLKATTVALWAGPFVLGAGGVLLLILHVRRRNAADTGFPSNTGKDRDHLDALLAHSTDIRNEE